METIILVGGLGTRLRSVVSDVPKPLAPVQGRPFLEWLMSYCLAQGSSRFILSIGYMADAIAGHFSDNARRAGRLQSRGRTARHRAVRGGRSRWFRKKGRLAKNGDSFCSVDHLEMQRLHDQSQSDCTIALFPRIAGPLWACRSGIRT